MTEKEKIFVNQLLHNYVYALAALSFTTKPEVIEAVKPHIKAEVDEVFEAVSKGQADIYFIQDGSHDKGTLDKSIPINRYMEEFGLCK